MSVRIQLDNPPNFYTNLDFIAGRIILALSSDESVSAILVKLEGESRTVLIRPDYLPPIYHGRQPMRQPPRRDSLAVENHKLLYKVVQVFPAQNSLLGGLRQAAFTLGAGQHEYPFRFKIPFNNSCPDPPSQQMGLGSGVVGFGLTGLQQMTYRHVKKTLPPSLTGLSVDAEIRYFVKVTVQRPSLWKENRRSAAGFRFLPIEPPRPPRTGSELYARRPYAFQAGLANYARKSNLFRTDSTTATLSDVAPKGELDARLPSPAILTCNEPVPLRLLARKLNDSPEYVFLMSLSIYLLADTQVRALDVVKMEKNSWVLVSLNSLAIPIGLPTDPFGTETLIDKSLWDRIPLPNTVAPSFQTCNLTRKYQLEVRVGLGYGLPRQIQPQTITLPLKFSIEVYSGVTPPAALLSAMASRPHHDPDTTATSHASTATNNPQPVSYDPAYPPQLGGPGAPALDDAPPSYEDAMADDIAPADRPRRDYSGITDVNAPELGEGKDPVPEYSARR